MRETDLAYLAGVLDSDGFITVARTTKKLRRGTAESTSTYYSARAGIAGTRRQPHDFAASLFGGSVHAHEPKNAAHRIQFNWSVSSRLAAVMLRAVRPYLLVKTEQADLVLQLQDLVERQYAEIRVTQGQGRRVPPEMVAERERIFQAVRDLNQDRRAAYRVVADAHA